MRNWLTDEEGKIIPRGYPSVEFWIKLNKNGEKEEEEVSDFTQSKL
jgi:hypothetical protein